MIQDIFPNKLDNSFRNAEPDDEDFLLAFDREGKLFSASDEGRVIFTKAKDFGKKEAVYLFSVDEKRFFLALDPSGIHKDGFAYHAVRDLFDVGRGWEVYAAFTAFHLWEWYTDNRYCGRCRAELVFRKEERALVCPECGNIVYPRINPAVIVGVINGDRLLLTRYRTGYSHNALVAGFTEIGETMEETVAREVMEETGVAVKNITYYKSQPWGIAQDVLIGYFCEVSGDPHIHMDKNELKYAEWVSREDIVLQPNNLSLTNEMMRIFKEGQGADTLIADRKIDVNVFESGKRSTRHGD